MTNTETMNECLLVKWIWKIEKGSDETWFKILQAKYMPDGSFLSSKSRGISQFWQILHKVKHLFKWGAIYKTKGGSSADFWDDVWIGDTPLGIQFLQLFNMCKFPHSRLAANWEDGDWAVEFRRSLDDREGAL